MAKHCVGPGIDHTAKREDGAHELWPNHSGTTPMHEYFRELSIEALKRFAGPIRSSA